MGLCVHTKEQSSVGWLLQHNSPVKAASPICALSGSNDVPAVIMLMAILCLSVRVVKSTASTISITISTVTMRFMSANSYNAFSHCNGSELFAKSGFAFAADPIV